MHVCLGFVFLFWLPVVLPVHAAESNVGRCWKFRLTNRTRWRG